MMTRNLTKTWAYLTLLILTQWLSGCAVNPTTGDREMVLMSEEQEIAIGRENHQKFVQHFGLYDDPALQAYVQEVGEKVARNSHRTGLIYRFTVLDSPDINAFALPGGYIYITRGMMAYLQSEDQLAAVLGHEVGHVTARHAVRQHRNATLTGLLGAVISSKAGTQSAGDLTRVFGTAIVQGYSREHELEADQLGAEYTARANYNPEAMINVIQILSDQEKFERQRAKEENREPNIYHGVFSSHPASDRRLRDITDKAKSLYRPGQTTAQSRERYLQKIDGMVYGDSAKQGIRRGNRFYHADMGFALAFPEKWRIENRPDRLLAYPPSADAMIQVTATDRNRRIPPKDFLQSRLKINDLEKGTAFNSHGLEGYTGLSEMRGPFGLRQTRVAVIYYEDRAFIFLAAEKNNPVPKTYDPAFIDTIQSLHRLTDQERELAKPLRLRIKKVQPGTRYGQLATQSRLSNYPEAQLRLLNHDYPSGEPVPGQALKLVE